MRITNLHRAIGFGVSLALATAVLPGVLAGDAAPTNQSVTGPLDISKVRTVGTYKERLEPKSDGKVMSADDMAFMTGCFNMIKEWQADCSLESDPDGTSTDLGPFFEDMLAEDRLAEDEVLDDNVAANASPHWPNVPTGRLPSGLGVPSSELSDQYKALMAAVLVHESSHLTNPQASFAYEDQELSAHLYSQEAFCDLVGCDKISAKEKNGICRAIGMANKVLCKAFEHQMICPGCMTLPDPHKVNTDRGCEDIGYIPPPSPAAFPVRTKSYQGMGLVGQISLTPNLNLLEIDLLDPVDSNDINLSIDLYADFSATFQATALDLLAPFGASSLYLAGFDSATLEGEVVRFDFDFSSDPPYHMTSVYKGTGFQSPLSLVTIDSHSNQVVILDSFLDSVIQCNTVSDVCTTLATPAQASLLPLMKSLHWSRTIDPATGAPVGSVVSAVASPHDPRKYSTYGQNCVTIIDHDGDGIVDEIHQ